MITETDALKTVEFKNYYVILPAASPKWEVDRFIAESNRVHGAYAHEGFSYISGNNDHFLNVSELRQLIRENLISP